MRVVRTSVSFTTSWVVALLLIAAGAVMAPPATALSDSSSLRIDGRGWGHGRGMSQWGALGYAVDHHATYDQITHWYYQGTRLSSDAGNPGMTVRLESMQGLNTIVTSAPGTITVSGSAGTIVSGGSAVLVSRLADGRLQVFTGGGCGGPSWTAVGAPSAGPVTISGAGGDLVDRMLHVCGGSSTTAYRGSVVAVNDGARQQTVVALSTQDYLRGVVPHEVSGGWGDLGGGRGMHALRAQAVAARSYALAGQRYPYAQTCDTIACQVFGGTARVQGGTVQVFEDPRTDRAVAETTGQVMRSNANGTIARTEFSASSGGWTAGGEFPAVVDEGDDYAGNPNNSWSTQMTVGTLRARLGVPAVRSITVTQRNGLGPMGGRVQTLVVDTGAQQRSFTGAQVRSALGLKSDWFTIVGAPTEEDRRYVRSLYLDFLGREPDPAGADGWSTALASGTSRLSVATSLTRTDEWLGHVVDGFYLDTLGRPADPSGRAAWIAALRNGTPVASVAASFYASDEYFARAGGDTRAWVQDLYGRLLQRLADPQGLQDWSSVARSRGRLAVTLPFYNSYESAGVRVNALYVHLLGRGPDPTGASGWIPVVQSRGDLSLAATLATSDEYWYRAQGR